LNYGNASTAIANAVSAAQAMGVPAAAVVVDRAGHIVASARMDGSNYLAVAMAHRKARTAAVLGMPSGQFAEMVSGDPVVLAAMASDQEIVLLGGGLPIIVDGVVVGGIGISGADQPTDTEIARRGLYAD
jgi:glc operon protein GlcG